VLPAALGKTGEEVGVGEARTYRSRLTGEGLTPVLVSGAGAVGLIIIGFAYASSRGLSAAMPVLVAGVVLLLLLGLTLWRQVGQTVTITPTGIRWEGPLGHRVLAWQEIVDFEDAALGMGRGRRARIGDGRDVFYLESGFFPEYLQMVSLIVIARRRHQHTWLLVNREGPVTTRVGGE